VMCLYIAMPLSTGTDMLVLGMSCHTGAGLQVLRGLWLAAGSARLAAGMAGCMWGQAQLPWQLC
jgi:hypothetical protein